MTKTTKWLAVAALWLGLAATARADIGPKPTWQGRNPLPDGADIEGLTVQMVSEEVDLLLAPVGEVRDTLSVTARFTMRNDGPETSFETGFPIGPYMSMKDFSVRMDGEKVDFEVVNRGAPEKERQNLLDDSGPRPDYWFVWPATWPAERTIEVEVRYRLELFRPTGWARAGYVLHTGAPWKGPIEKAVVTLRFADPLTPDQVDEITPVDGGRRLEDRYVWTFTDLEPTEEHDIAFTRVVTPAGEITENFRKGAAQGWRGRNRFAERLMGEPSRHLRRRFTEEELIELLTTVESLVAGLARTDEELRLPGTGPDGDRAPWVRRPSALTAWIPRLTEVVTLHPESPRARRLLETFVTVGEALVEGRLDAGGEAPVLEDEARETARRDLAAAREVLGAGD